MCFNYFRDKLSISENKIKNKVKFDIDKTNNDERYKGFKEDIKKYSI